MSLVHADEVLSDAVLRSKLSLPLVAALQGAWSEAQGNGHGAVRGLDGYELSVDRNGSLVVTIMRPGGFHSWVHDAGPVLAHSVGPERDPFGADTVDSLTGTDAAGAEVRLDLGLGDKDFAPASADGDGAAAELAPEGDVAWQDGGPLLHWPGWSPLAASADGPRVTVETGSVVEAWRCDVCGAASCDADDWEAIQGGRRCECGAVAVPASGVYCESCDTLILLRSLDPSAVAQAPVLPEASHGD